MENLQKEILEKLRGKFGIAGNTNRVADAIIDGILYVLSLLGAAAMCIVDAIMDAARAFMERWNASMAIGTDK